MQAAQGYRWGWKAVALILVSTVLSGCGINKIPTLDEQAKAAWAQVQNQYQRRADLIPNLVEVVKGYAAHEQDTLTAVIEARAKATSIQVDASKRSMDGAAATHTYSGYTITKNARVNAINTGRRPNRSDSRPDSGITTVISATANICTINTWSSGRPRFLWAKVGMFTSTT